MAFNSDTDRHWFACKHCDSKFGSEEAQEQHTAHIHGIWECVPCSKKFGSKQGRDTHKKALHSVWWECHRCFKQFKSESAVDNHVRHRNIECTVKSCYQFFKTESGRDNHIKVHGLFMCYCGRRFKSEEGRDAHDAVVHPLHECEMCHTKYRKEQKQEPNVDDGMNVCYKCREEI